MSPTPLLLPGCSSFGTGNTLQTANISYQEKQRLLRGLAAIEADVLLIDIGVALAIMPSIFMFSDMQICVVLPDPLIMDLYTFLQLAPSGDPRLFSAQTMSVTS
jgi:hypothetical protein